MSVVTTTTVFPFDCDPACPCNGGTPTTCQSYIDALISRVGNLFVSFSSLGCFLTGQTVELVGDLANHRFQFTGTVGACVDTFVFRIRCIGEDLVFEVVSQNGSPDGRTFVIGIVSDNPFYGTYGTGTDTLNCNSPFDFCTFGGVVQE